MEFLASSGGREFVAGVAGVLAGHPLDTLRVRLQQPPPPYVRHGITAARRPPASAAAMLQAQTSTSGGVRYRGVADCFRKSVREEGLPVLWRGLGTTVVRAFVVNGAIFSAHELALRFLASGKDRQRLVMEEN